MMKLYESSGKTKRLKIYQMIPKMIAAPLLYLTCSNYWAVYKFGLLSFPLLKGMFWNFWLAFSLMIDKNLKNNANTVIDKFYLMGDGQRVKMVKIDGVATSNPISCLKPLTAEMHQ